VKRALAVLILGLPLAAEPPRFVKIPAGEFIMGCEPGLKCAETFPTRKVVIDASFELAATETTVDQFREFVRAAGYRTDAEKENSSNTWLAPGFKVAGRQPVTQVSLNDAEAYCAWIGGRIPTEAEWEYAAKAGTTTRHYWGEGIDPKYLWYRVNSDDHPHPVAQKPANPWGLFDIEGNVWERVRGTAENSITFGRHPGSVRGGGWVTCPQHITTHMPFVNFKSLGFNATGHSDDTGFRCAR